MADTKLAKVGITVKESWKGDISYEVLDYTLWRVQDGGDGCGYIAKRANIGVVPNSDDSVWIKATQAGQSIYDLAVKYGHFEGTEEEFEAEYQAVLQAARDAASETSATNTEIQEAEELRKTAENTRVENETARQTAETGRQTAETARETAESGRQTAETQRGENETTRQSREAARESSETQRQSNEATRQTQETARESAELERTADFEALKTDMETATSEADAATAAAVALNNQVAGDESARQTAESGRVAAETQRQTAETQRGTNESTRQTQETARQTAEQTRNTQETARQTAEGQRATAEQGRASAESQRVSNETARQTAETARETQATTDHQRAESDHAIAESDHAQMEGKANVADLEDGTLVPALAGNLKSWNDRSEQNVESAMTDTHRSTAGDESVNADSGATLLSIIATSDFSASKLIASGFNLLRLQSNNGLAVAIGAGWYFPVPTLTFGAYGTAEQNNGVLFTDSEGNNLTPTVRFQPLADGVPTSVNDGSVCEYTDSNGKRFYTTPGPGWLIVTGITWATTCAHMAWSMLYDKFVAPDDADDAGTIIDLSALGTMRVVGSGAGLVSDRADRISATQMRLTAYVGRVRPAWTRGAQDEETGLYPYTATISGIKSGGIAEFEGDDKPEIIVDGTTLTYYSDSSTALTDYVKYQLAAPTTANKNVATDLAHINDWGIDALIGASGAAIINLQYAQGIPDALVQLLSKIDNSTVPAIAAAFAWMDARIRLLESRLVDAYNRIDIYAKKVYAEDIFVFNTPMILESLEAGAPAAARVPKNWNQDTMGVWSGVPKKVGQVYIDRSSKKVYVATNLSNSTNDWSLMN